MSDMSVSPTASATVLSPLGLDTKQSLRLRLNFYAVSHPALMRYLKTVSADAAGDVIVALAEEGIRAKLGLSISGSAAHTSAPAEHGTPVVAMHTDVAPTFEQSLPRTSNPPAQVAAERYSKDELAAMFPSWTAAAT